MISIPVLKIAWSAFRVIKALYPIGQSVYDAYQGHSNSSKKTKPLTAIKKLAKDQGINIGNTEAELIRSAIHYAEGKVARHKTLKGVKKD
jgi:hypothetical protein